VAQVVGENYFSLLEVVPKTELEVYERIFMRYMKEFLLEKVRETR